MNKRSELIDMLRKLLMSRKASSQESICKSLSKMGYKINQTKVSRLLHLVGAVKIKNAEGKIVYSLPRETEPHSVDSKIKSLILDISSNESLVIIQTTPGAASMIARVIDYNQIATDVLGTIAGDDTIFVAPKTVKTTSKLALEMKKLLIGRE